VAVMVSVSTANPVEHANERRANPERHRATPSIWLGSRRAVGLPSPDAQESSRAPGRRPRLCRATLGQEMSATQSNPSTPTIRPGILGSGAPTPAVGIALVVVLGLAALVPDLRLPVVVVLGLGVLVAPTGTAWRWAAAAGLPVALVMAWATIVADRLIAHPLDCADPLSPEAWLRVAAALLVVTVVVGLAHYLRTSLRDIGLRKPSRAEVWLGLAAIVLIPIPSLYLGAVLAEPFFGEIRLDLSQPLAIVPALLLAVANGTMEELAYRGALMHWLSRAAGPLFGLVGQSVIFGLAHTGSDFTGPMLPVVLAVMAAGLIAGLVVRRTGSLWLVIVVHICFDVPLYYAAVCRL
jgi:membrane protease YdiL (CAAX protease family)